MAEEQVHRMEHIRFQHYYQHFVCRTTVILLMGKCNVYCGMCYVPCAMILLAKMCKYEIINVKCNIKFASSNYLDCISRNNKFFDGRWYMLSFSSTSFLNQYIEIFCVISCRPFIVYKWSCYLLFVSHQNSRNRFNTRLLCLVIYLFW